MFPGRHLYFTGCCVTQTTCLLRHGDVTHAEPPWSLSRDSVVVGSARAGVLVLVRWYVQAAGVDLDGVPSGGYTHHPYLPHLLRLEHRTEKNTGDKASN